eukprot:ctg_1142.g376
MAGWRDAEIHRGGRAGVGGAHARVAGSGAGSVTIVVLGDSTAQCFVGDSLAGGGHPSGFSRMGNVVTDDAIVVEEAQIVRMADIDDATPAVRKTDRLYPPRIDPLSALTVSERLQRLEERLEWVVEVEPPGADAAMALADLLPSAVEGDRVLALRPSDPRWLGVFRAVSALKTYARAFLERRRMPGADDDAPAQFQLLRALYRLRVNSATAVAAAAANPPCALVSVAALRLLHEALVCVPSTDDAADEKTPWSALRPAIAGALMLLRWVLLRPALPNGADQEWQAEAQALTVRLACQYLQRLRVAPDAVSATVMEELLLILLLTLHASYAHRAPIRLWVLTERPAALVSALLHALSHTTRLAATPEVHSPDSSDVISRAEVYMYTEHKALDLLITRRPLGAQAANRHDVASSSHRWAEAMKGDAAAAAAASRPRSWSSLLIYLLPFGRSSASRSTEEGSEKDAWQRWTREYTRLSDAEREFLRLLAEPLSDVPESPRETTLADAGATAAVDVKEAATSRTLPCLTMIVLLALLVTPAPVAEVDAATDARKHAPRAHYPFLAALTALTDASRTRRAAPSGDALRSNPLAGGYGEPAGARCALNALFEALATRLLVAGVRGRTFRSREHRAAAAASPVRYGARRRGIPAHQLSGDAGGRRRLVRCRGAQTPGAQRGVVPGAPPRGGAYYPRRPDVVRVGAAGATLSRRCLFADNGAGGAVGFGTAHGACQPAHSGGSVCARTTGGTLRSPLAAPSARRQCRRQHR